MILLKPVPLSFGLGIVPLFSLYFSRSFDQTLFLSPTFLNTGVIIKEAMWAVSRRRVSSSSVLGQSFRNARPSRCYSSSSNEAYAKTLVSRKGTSQVAGIVGSLGFPVGSRPLRDVISFVQRYPPIFVHTRSFSADSGELVDAVVPFMGESITDGTLASFLKHPGDRVEVDEPIAQIETDNVLFS
ncbi:hypothetical protein J1N35_033727 [Gossypium stocksii]|uniref:Lipoyl-binding domain-containing protein n=1 Tax=Gossypium stocksii TaxID=47602 RepID=A0A9D3UQR2_9ROSI|nr:hypothetical protein J1N35_033727 [Gossypium stocksii]